MTGHLFDNKIDAYVLFNDENRRYFSGACTTFGCVILHPAKCFFITDPRYQLAVSEQLNDTFELVITDYKNFYPEVSKALTSLGVKHAGIEDDTLPYGQYLELKKTLPGISLKAASDRLNAVMAVKTDAEIANIAESQRINEAALEAALSEYRPKMTEADFMAEYIYQSYKHGAEDMAFAPIIAFGANAAKPHHHPGDKLLIKGETFIADIGVKYKGYCSDMTRTFTIGEPSKAMKTVYETVLAAQNYALSKIKAGMTGNEADSFAREYIDSHGYGREFGHGLGHGVGLRIHESPRVGKGADNILLENMIITVEPGIYIEGVGGVRIEDMAVVKKDGIVNLTNFRKTYYLDI